MKTLLVSSVYAAYAGESALPESPSPETIAGQLVRDLREHYGNIRSIRSASIGEIWRGSRDLVLSIDHWATRWTFVEGQQKMDIAVDASMQFIAQHGGVDALRDRIAGAFGGILPGFLKRFVVGRMLSEGVIRRIIRFVLELAVRELRDIRS